MARNEKPEPWPLPDAERRLIHCVTTADALLQKWSTETVAWQEENAKTRDTILDQCRTVRDALAKGTLDINSPDTFTRVGYEKSLGWCRQHIGVAITNLEDTLQNWPYEAVDKVPAEDLLIEEMMQYVLIGKMRNPDDEPNSPLVYVTISRNNMLQFQTYLGNNRLSHMSVFKEHHVDQIEVAAVTRHNEISGARYAVAFDNIKRIEHNLIKSDINACRKALDAGRILGYSGARTEAHVDAEVLRVTQARQRTQPKIADFRSIVGNLDERFSDEMISRAAGSLHQHRIRIPNLTDDVMRAYIFDYIMSYADRRSWDIEIIPHVQEHPSSFAAEWNFGHHTGPFQGVLANPNSFTIADLPDLVALTYIASSTLQEPSVKPSDAHEQDYRQFYGDLNDNDLPGLADILDMAYYGELILTTRWAECMAKVYRTENLPPVPRIFTIAPPLANPDSNADLLAYSVFYNRITKGGVKAINAITQQTMHRLFELITTDCIDMAETRRVIALQVQWLLDEPNDTLDVTPENRLVGQDHVNIVERAHRRLQDENRTPVTFLAHELVDFEKNQLKYSRILRRGDMST